jgi:hypothetical protein
MQPSLQAVSGLAESQFTHFLAGWRQPRAEHPVGVVGVSHQASATNAKSLALAVVVCILTSLRGTDPGPLVLDCPPMAVLSESCFWAGPQGGDPLAPNRG